MGSFGRFFVAMGNASCAEACIHRRTFGAVISYFIGSSWGMLMPLGVTLASQSGANILPVIGAVFASGTFGAFASPLSDNTVTLCTILDLPVMEYARTKLVPSLIAAVLFGAASFLLC